MIPRHRQGRGRLSVLAVVALMAAEQAEWRNSRAYAGVGSAPAAEHEPPAGLSARARRAAARRLRWYAPDAVALRLGVRALRRIVGGGE
jgi:hypothetical protein